MARMVHCIKKNKELEGLAAFPSVPGELAKRSGLEARSTPDDWDASADDDDQ